MMQRMTKKKEEKRTGKVKKKECGRRLHIGGD
jgi:hypothetical protein